MWPPIEAQARKPDTWSAPHLAWWSDSNINCGYKLERIFMQEKDLTSVIGQLR